MVGFKSKNQQSEKEEQLVVIIPFWGGKNEKKINQESLVNALCCSHNLPPLPQYCDSSI